MGTSTDLKVLAAIAVAPAAWTVQLLASYPLAQLSCAPGLGRPPLATLHTIAIGALLIIAGDVLFLRYLDRAVSGQRIQFMVHLGLRMCALFAIVVVATWLPPFFLRHCEA